jgi:3-deoxy-D-manno-octulosonic-acid transferase
MNIPYEIGMQAYQLGMRAAASFLPKAKKRIQGMEDYWTRLETAIKPTSDVLWVHAASLGELEQGIPVIEKIRATYTEHEILLTFSSPSGFENFKNEGGLVDHIFYLPVDTAANADRFISTIAPDLAFFIKYEIWLNFLLNLQAAGVPVILAPAVFRPKQFYFKWFGQKYFLPVLRKIDRILVQDKASKELLEVHKFDNVEIAGDSRYDRAMEIAERPFEDEVLKEFSAGNFTLIAGSSWEQDEAVLLDALSKTKDTKLIIAPHEVTPESIERVRKTFGKANCALHSTPPMHYRKTRVLIIDSIGILSKAYRYGQVAFVGGGFKQGVHSTIEPVVYGLPVFFGPKHTDFVEPSEMIAQGVGFEVNEKEGFAQKLQQFITHPKLYEETCEKAKKFGKTHAGGASKIMGHVERLVYKVPVVS